MLKNKTDKIQFFLLPFAGGNIYSYNFLKIKNADDIDLIFLELPGRGKRLREKLSDNADDVIQEYYTQIKKNRNESPYVIFGHSMGAIMGFYATAQLEKDNDPPIALVVSGNAGPGIEREDQLHLLSSTDFKLKLKELGGVPHEVIENNDLFNFFEPILRSDFKCIEQFSPKSIVIDTPIFAIMGSEEKTSDQIENWKKFTTSCFKYRILNGNHFFIYNHHEFLLDLFKQLTTINIESCDKVNL